MRDAPRNASQVPLGIQEIGFAVANLERLWSSRVEKKRPRVAKCLQKNYDFKYWLVKSNEQQSNCQVQIWEAGIG